MTDMTIHDTSRTDIDKAMKLLRLPSKRCRLFRRNNFCEFDIGQSFKILADLK